MTKKIVNNFHTSKVRFWFIILAADQERLATEGYDRLKMLEEEEEGDWEVCYEKLYIQRVVSVHSF